MRGWKEKKDEESIYRGEECEREKTDVREGEEDGGGGIEGRVHKS